MKLKIEIDTDSISRGDLATFLREIANHAQRGIDPDVRRPVKAFGGREIGYYVVESPIVWPAPLTEADM